MSIGSGSGGVGRPAGEAPARASGLERWPVTVRLLAASLVALACSNEAVVGGRSIRYHDEPIPLRSLARTLGALDGLEEPWAMVVEVAGRRLAFAIDQRQHGTCLSYA